VQDQEETAREVLTTQDIRGFPKGTEEERVERGSLPDRINKHEKAMRFRQQASMNKTRAIMRAKAAMDCGVDSMLMIKGPTLVGKIFR
jgi:hypothetical protein